MICKFFALSSRLISLTDHLIPTGAKTLLGTKWNIKNMLNKGQIYLKLNMFQINSESLLYILPATEN